MSVDYPRAPELHEPLAIGKKSEMESFYRRFGKSQPDNAPSSNIFFGKSVVVPYPV